MSGPPPSGQQPPSGQVPPAGQPQPAPQQPAQYQQAQYQQAQYAPPQAPPRPRGRAGWGPLLVVIVIMLAVVLGGHALGGTVGQLGGDVPVGEPVAVTESVAVSLPENWAVVGQLGGGLPGLSLASDVANANVVVASGSGTPADILAFYQNEVLAPQADQLSVGEPGELELASGDAASFEYIGIFPEVDVPLEGEVIGIATPSGIPVIIDAWAPEGNYGPIRDQVLAMADSVVTA